MRYLYWYNLQLRRIPVAKTLTGCLMSNSTHESFSRDETVAAGSDRSFGLIFAAALAILTLINAWHGGRLWPWTRALAALFLVGALFYPAALNPLNRIWHRFGLILHKLVNPIVMGLVFFGTVLPTGLIMKAMGKDSLRLRRDPRAASYWILRQPPGPAPETMKDQF